MENIIYTVGNSDCIPANHTGPFIYCGFIMLCTSVLVIWSTLQIFEQNVSVLAVSSIRKEDVERHPSTHPWSPPPFWRQSDVRNQWLPFYCLYLWQFTATFVQKACGRFKVWTAIRSCAPSHYRWVTGRWWVWKQWQPGWVAQWCLHVCSLVRRPLLCLAWLVPIDIKKGKD